MRLTCTLQSASKTRGFTQKDGESERLKLLELDQRALLGTDFLEIQRMRSYMKEEDVKETVTNKQNPRKN